MDERRRPGDEQRVLFDDGPVAGDVVEQDQADGIENARPEAFERTSGEKDSDANHIEHEQGDTLQIDDKDFSGKGRDHEECGADEEDLDDKDGEKGLKVGPEMIRTDAGVVCPGCEGADKSAEHHAGEGEYGGNEGASPASAEVGELGDGLRKENLIGVTLEVAEDRQCRRWRQ